jgi:single-stranded-DNA-specific exonuclease
MIKIAQSQIDPSKYLLHAMGEEFHEGIVGIVSGRLTEKYYKPSLVLGINKEEGTAMGSLRGPDYFNVVEMLKTADDLLLRYGGHAQAGGLTVRIEDLEEVLARFHAYCDQTMGGKIFEKTDSIDCKIYARELNYPTVKQLFDIAPFGQGNPEPVLMIENFMINTRKTLGKKNGQHLKLIGHVDGVACTVLFWSKAEEYSHLTP